MVQKVIFGLIEVQNVKTVRQNANSKLLILNFKKPAVVKAQVENHHAPQPTADAWCEVRKMNGWKS